MFEKENFIQDMINSDPEIKRAKAYFEKEGISFNSSLSGLDNNVAALKGFMDTMNSQSQLDMIRLQGLINKRNQAFEMVSNALSKLSKPRDAIISNMR